MKKYLVIGNPISHSQSPQLHNHWIKEYNLDAIYEKKKLDETDIEKIISDLKSGKIDGINVTIPFKKTVIPFLEELTPEAAETQSVNTIYNKKNKIIGNNTDIGGFEYAIKHIKYNVKGKTILILGAGGVTPSIVVSLKKMGAYKIILSNRTKEKAEKLKKIYPYINIINWGDISDFDMIINATSLGLNKGEKIELNYKDIGPNKLFYDVIYNPAITNFLSRAKEFGNQIENGKGMFVYQAKLAFEIWHGVKPSINKKVFELLNND